MGNDWKTYSGVVHVHTDRSGGAPFEQILEAARECGVKFVVLTDTGIRMEEVAELAGWHDGVLVLVGEQVCCPDGHFLAFDTTEEIGHATSFEHSLERVRSQSGSAVGIHYHFRSLKTPAALPSPLRLEYVDIVELWSFHDEFVSNARGRMPVQFHARPERLVVGPHRGTVKEWDRELALRPLPAVGSVNALCRKEPLLDWKEFFPLKSSFGTIRTVVQCPELPPQRAAAVRMAWSALRSGRSYIANVALGSPDGFDFRYVTPEGGSHGMGETTVYRPGSHVQVTLPHPAEVVVRLNGHPLFWGTGQSFSFPAPIAGVYRVEVNLERRAWIYSNAIRAMPDMEPKDRPVTVFDFT